MGYVASAEESLSALRLRFPESPGNWTTTELAGAASPKSARGSSSDLAIITVEAGLIHFRLEIYGRESYAGNRYVSVHAGGLGNRAGVNAIEKLLRVVNALQDTRNSRGTR